jgi:hypothetical protein
MRYLPGMRLNPSSGPARVLASGELTTFFGHPLRLALELPEGPFDVEFQFSNDPSLDGVAVHSAPTDAGIRLELVNFNRADGRGTAEPMLLGAVGDDLLFLHFRAFRFGETLDHTLHFTAYRASRADVGWHDLPASEP